MVQEIKEDNSSEVGPFFSGAWHSKGHLISRDGRRGRTDGRTDVRMERQAHGEMDGRADGRMRNEAQGKKVPQEIILRNEGKQAMS